MSDLIDTTPPADETSQVTLAPGVTVPGDVLRVKFVRSGGPGGQNVNKVATAAQLRVWLRDLPLSEPASLRLATLAGSRLTADGELLIQATAGRTQEANRRDAIGRLADLVSRSLLAPKLRRKTKMSRGAKARRREAKARRSRTKANRRNPLAGG